MKLNFDIRQLNSPFDDSVFFIRTPFRKRAFLLDCGRLGGLRQVELLSLGEIFVSHTHMDHFFGFDRILRSCHAGDQHIALYGPVGIIRNVWGKFAGYTWNLTENYSFTVSVYELDKSGRISC
ncbi:MAG: ribonuclease Z, partial [Deferribacteraceae bacterium]|nr:ribonuclease Z [Deferribacteraceae bacterium]